MASLHTFYPQFWWSRVETSNGLEHDKGLSQTSASAFLPPRAHKTPKQSSK